MVENENEKDEKRKESSNKMADDERQKNEQVEENSKGAEESHETSHEQSNNIKPWDNVQDYPDKKTLDKVEDFFRGGFKMTKADLKTLLPGRWLNDQIISAFIRTFENDPEVDLEATN